jgi:hypothetical protein
MNDAKVLSFEFVLEVTSRSEIEKGQFLEISVPIICQTLQMKISKPNQAGPEEICSV